MLGSGYLAVNNLFWILKTQVGEAGMEIHRVGV